MTEIQNDRTAEPRDEKKPYERPQLVKHGKVEEQTLGVISIPPNTSRPV